MSLNVHMTNIKIYYKIVLFIQYKCEILMYPIWKIIFMNTCILLEYLLTIGIKKISVEIMHKDLDSR